MGQSASKATEVAKRAAPRISQTAQTARNRAAAEAEWKRFTEAEAAASASPNEYGGEEYSPTRGEQHRGGDGDPDTMPEMPPDLIKFLNDAGPLERTVDKELTSAKVYDALVSDEGAREEQAKQANLRVRRKMPIMSSYRDDAKESEGTMVERTTNFSTVDRSEVPMGLGVAREDMFRLSDELKGLKVDSPAWKKIIEHEYQGIAKNSKKTKDFDQLKDMALFQNSLRYIGVPVMLKDTDGDIIGVWRHKSDEMRFSLGLKPIPEKSLQFAMLSEKDVAGES